jgi:RNA polymerase sigma-70 factor (ECF subfamily)
VSELPQSEIGDMPEAEAIRLAREGNAAAFERLYRLHSRRVFTLCVRMLENLAEAEDLTQETFLTVFRRIQTFRGESGFSTWLHRVTVNVVLMRIRKKTVAQTSLEEITERTEDSRAHPLELSTPDLYLNGTIDRLALQKAIDQLPPGFKAQFVLHDVEGYEHHEIADMRGCSTGTSKSQLHRSRLRLRELLQKDQNNGALGKANTANCFDFEAECPGRLVHHPPVHGNKIVPFKRKRDAPIRDLTTEIDRSPAAHACAAVK